MYLNQVIALSCSTTVKWSSVIAYIGALSYSIIVIVIVQLYYRHSCSTIVIVIVQLYYKHICSTIVIVIIQLYYRHSCSTIVIVQL